MRAVADRMRATIEELANRHPGGRMAAVSHDVPIRLLLGEITGLDGSPIWDIDLPTGCITTLTVTSSGAIEAEGVTVP